MAAVAQGERVLRPLDPLIDVVLHARIDAARVLLSPGEQRAIELVVSQGLQVVEAAAEAGVARETMGRQRDRAVAALRNAFGTLR